MPRGIRKHVYLSSADVEAIHRLVLIKGGAAGGHSFSTEVSAAIREHVRRQTLHQQEADMAPLLQRLLEEKFLQLEAWLRPGVWGGATYGTTAALLLLEHMCGKSLDPRDAKEYFDLIRGRAWKIVRKDHATGDSGQRKTTRTEDD